MNAPHRPQQVHVRNIQIRNGKPLPGQVGADAGKRFLVKWSVDGHDKTKSFDSHASAVEHQRLLRRAIDQGLHFELPSALPRSMMKTETVLDAARDFIKARWAGWAPGTRAGYVRVLALTVLAARLPGGVTPGQQALQERYELLVTALHPHAQLTELQHAELQRVASRTRSLRDLNDPRVMQHVFDTMIAGLRSRPLKPASQTRYSTNFKSFIAKSIADRSLSLDALSALQDRARGRTRSLPKDHAMTQDEVRAVADAIGHVGLTGARYVAFVLVMGVCGLRFGEASALRLSDLDLDGPATTQSWVHVRESMRTTSKKYSETEQSRGVAPVKNATVDDPLHRRAPAPPWLAELLRQHCRSFQVVDQNQLVFTNSLGKSVLPQNFRALWRQARTSVFPLIEDLTDNRQPYLTRATPHDLRHAAITEWFSAGVQPKVAMTWSGHASLQIFLEVYVNFRQEDEDESLAKLQQRRAPVEPQGDGQEPLAA